MINGYRFGSDDWQAQYIPELNQIWIKFLKKNNSNEILSEIKDEEFVHIYLSGLTPSHLFPLFNRLSIVSGHSYQREDTENFRDIVESLYPAYRQIILEKPLTTYHVNYKERNLFKTSAKKIVRLAEKYAEYYNKNFYNEHKEHKQEEIKKKSFQAIMNLLLHIIPSEKSTFTQIIQFIETHLPEESWQHKHEILAKMPSTSLFKTIPPLELHGALGDLCVFLTLTVVAHHKNPDSFLPYLPSLLCAFSFGFFTMIPVLYLLTKRKKIADIFIEIVHTTKNSHHLLKNTIQQLREVAKEMKNCEIYSLCLKFLKQTEEIVTEKSTQTIEQFLDLVWQVTPELCYILNKSKDCVYCKLVRSQVSSYSTWLGPYVKNSSSIFHNVSKKYRNWLIEQNVKNIDTIKHYKTALMPNLARLISL